MGKFCPLSAEFLETIPNKYLDLVYAEQSEEQILDLYLPAEKPRAGGYPVIVFIHGGAFANGYQRENQILPALRALDRGFAVAGLRYRKSREARFPAMVYDGKAALRFLRANAEKYRLDKTRIAVWGASSGAWLASMLGVTAGNPAFEDLSMGFEEQDSSVQAVVDWCGPCGNFLLMDEDFRQSGKGNANHSAEQSPESRFMGRAISEIPELVSLACPMRYCSPETPPILLLHGAEDEVVPVEQSARFYQALKASGNTKAELHIVEGGKHHGDAWYNEEWVSDEAIAFIASALNVED